jgi:hypothetical protein
MNQVRTNDGVVNPQMDAGQMADYRALIERLPITMRPTLNQQLAGWESLFPFERNQLTNFLNGLASFQPSALSALTQPLKSLETKMGVEHWNFSQSGDTMENASMLARSEYYAEWRQQVQILFERVNAEARDTTAAPAKQTRLILVVLPATLPVEPMEAWQPWNRRAQVLKIEGDSRKISELLLQGNSNQPSIATVLARQQVRENFDLWLIDADEEMNRYQSAAAQQTASSLSYAMLKPFRDKFLAEVNTVPKNIEATDQTFAALRQRDWEPWLPTEFAAEPQLRNFLVNLFLSGNGALIFSNAFVEWATAEALRRARPRVIVARFGLRSKPKLFTSIAIFENQQRVNMLPDVDDPEGSAIDTLILARYIWLAASRYPEQEQTCCLCISEHLNSAYMIVPDSIALPGDPAHAVTPEELAAWVSAYLAA